MLVKKLNSAPSMKSFPLLFVASRNTTFSSLAETWMPKLGKTENGIQPTKLVKQKWKTSYRFRERKLIKCLNTNFQKRERKLWTCTYPNNTKAQIDDVFINKEWNNCTLNCEAYSSFEVVSTDHRIVTAKIRLSVRKNAIRTKTIVHYDWALLNSRDIRDKYTLALILSGQDIHYPTIQPHRTQNWLLRKNQNGFRRNRSTTSRILIICRILESGRAKKRESTILFVDFTKAFDSIHRGKMKQILLAYGLPKETVEAIMILYRNTKVKIRSPDGDTDDFDIVTGVLQEDTLAPYLFIICLDYVLKTSINKIKENGLKVTKERSRRYPAKTITDDIALLANAHVQAETLLHCLERAAAGIGLHVNAHKTEYMFLFLSLFNGISTL